MDLEEGSRGTNLNASYNEPRLILNHEKEPINEKDSSLEVDFLWPSSVSDSYCCIYRVPYRLKRVNPEAYTPQVLLIGPLHHYKKSIAADPSKTDLRYMDYMKTERHKTKYLEHIALRYGKETVKKFRRIIERDEQVIRACYSESTDWIKSCDFVEMMLRDSVFILGFFMQLGPRYMKKTGDFVFDEPSYRYTIFEDLILLENQLPYLLLEKLFEPFFKKLGAKVTFRDVILKGFNFNGRIRRQVKFLHFTDLSRWASVETLRLTEDEINKELVKKKAIKSLHNACDLVTAGVKFEVSKENPVSLVIKFEDGILKMPYFKAKDSTEGILRNIMALEQCHYPYTAFVCNYINFLDYLIDTEQDVDLLVNKGIIKNDLGRHGSVAELVNKLCLGIIHRGSQYNDIAERLNAHLKSRFNKSVSSLRRVYFKDLWTGTATVAAVFILVLTLIGTVASVLQLKQKDNNSSTPLAPPPARNL